MKLIAYLYGATVIGTLALSMFIGYSIGYDHARGMCLPKMEVPKK